MTFSTAVYHDDVVRRAQADAADTVTCPHCPTLVARKRLNDHISAHHADIVLSDDERELYEQRNREIKEGLDSLERMAIAIADVRDHRLYREEYPTFEAYCKGYWGKKRAWGNNLARASYIINELATFVDSAMLPVRESQTRALASFQASMVDDLFLSRDYLAQAWTLMVSTTRHQDPKEVTASHIERVGRTIAEAIVTEGHVDIGNGESEPVTPLSFKAAVLTDEVETRLRQLEHITRNSKRQRVLSAEARQVRILESPMFTRVELQIPLTVDITELTAAIASGKPITVTLTTPKEDAS